jgi:hypothetical protein
MSDSCEISGTDKMLSVFDMLEEQQQRLSNVEARLADIEQRKFHEDAISTSGSRISALPYMRSFRDLHILDPKHLSKCHPIVIVNHAGMLTLSAAGVHTEYVMVKLGHGGPRFFDDSKEKVDSETGSASPSSRLQMEEDVEQHVITVLGGNDKWEAVLEQYALLSQTKDTPTCGDVGLGYEHGLRPDEELAEGLSELVLKHKFPEQVIAKGWEYLVLALHEDGSGRTWIQRAMEIAFAALAIDGGVDKTRQIQLYDMFWPGHDDDHPRARLYLAVVRQDDQAFKQAFRRMEASDRRWFRQAVTYKHSPFFERMDLSDWL